MYVNLKNCANECGIEKFNGIIHIGNKGWQRSKFYKEHGVNNILWIENNQNDMAELYSKTRDLPITSKYFCQSLSDGKNFSNMSFEQFVRKNIVEIDLDLYDLVSLDLHGSEKEVISGFGDLLNRFLFKAIYTNVNFKTIDSFDKFLYKRKYKRSLSIRTTDSLGEALYIKV